MEAKRDPSSERRRLRGDSRLRIALLVELLALVHDTPAHAAAQAHLALEYDVAPELAGCPNDESFRASIRSQLGYDPFERGSDRLVSVAITRRSVGFAGRIHWTQAGGNWSGDRRISSRRTDCSSIAADLAFAVVVQVQLLSTLEGIDSKARPPDSVVALPAAPPAPQNSTEPPQPVTSAAQKPTESPPVPPPPATVERTEIASERPPADDGMDARTKPETTIPSSPVTRLRLSAGVGSSLALGLSPEATGLGRVFLNGRRSWISLEFALDASLPVTHREGDATGFTLERVSAATAACGHLSLLSGCLTGSAGALRVHGTGVDVATTSTGAFYQLGIRLAAHRTFGDRYFVAARGEGLLLLSSWTVKVNDVPLWVTPRAGALLGVDVGANFF